MQPTQSKKAGASAEQDAKAEARATANMAVVAVVVVVAGALEWHERRGGYGGGKCRDQGGSWSLWEYDGV